MMLPSEAMPPSSSALVGNVASFPHTHGARTAITRSRATANSRIPYYLINKGKAKLGRIRLGSVRSTVPESPLSGGQPHPYSQRPGFTLGVPRWL